MVIFSYIGKSGLIILTTIILCFGIGLNQAEAGSKNKRTAKVNCNKGQSVQKVLNRFLTDKKALKIQIRGFCKESVTITRDDVFLSGIKDGDSGLTEITIDGARRINIEFLELTGNGYGLYAGAGATVDIRNCDIHDNEADGIAAVDQSLVRAAYNTIESNGRPDPHYESGISVSGSSVVRSKGNLIADNGYAGVGVANQSYFRSGLSTADGPPAPADLDVILQKGCTQGQTAGTCGAPGTIALDCFRSALCDYRNTDVTGIVEVGRASYFDARTSIINGDVMGFDGAGIYLRNTVSGSGLLSCSGESYANGSVGCGDMIP